MPGPALIEFMFEQDWPPAAATLVRGRGILIAPEPAIKPRGDSGIIIRREAAVAIRED